MFQVAVAVFREFVEISILLSLFSAAARNVKDFKLLLILGILLGCFGASLIALFTERISESLDGMGSEIFEAFIILLTVFMICSTLIWMKGYSKKIKSSIDNIKEGYSSSFSAKFMLTTLIATTIFREGSEIVLILHSLSAIEGNKQALTGFGYGAFAGITVGFGIYYGLFRFSTKHIFKISSLLMTFIAAGLAAEAAKILTTVGIINFLNSILWDTSFIISDNSLTGKILKILFGYTAKPTGIELIFYFLTLSIVFFSNKIFTRNKVK